MMEQAPKKKKSLPRKRLPTITLAGAVRVFWGFFIALMVVIPSLAVYLWWRDGMWAWGEMPTHGITYTIVGCGAALLLMGARVLLRNEQAGIPALRTVQSLLAFIRNKLHR